MLPEPVPAIDAAYAAGIIDGEGYIGVRRRPPGRESVHPHYLARVGVGMIHTGALDFLHATFGGSYYLERRHPRGINRWSVMADQAEVCLRVVLPYLRVKHEQALNVLEMRALQREAREHRTKVVGHRSFPNAYGTVRQVPNLAYSDDYVARLEAFYQEARRLNGRGEVS